MEIPEEEFHKEIYDELLEEERVSFEMEKKFKVEYYKKLETLVNVKALFSNLDEHDSWMPIGIVQIELTDEKLSGYPNHQIARVINCDDDKLRYMKTSFDGEVKGVEYYYVWQNEGYFGDDYSGFLLFPLNDGKFFKVSYSS